MADIYGNVWLCVDCTIALENGDYSGMDDATAAIVLSTIDQFGHISANWDSETGDGISDSRKYCDGCGRDFFGTFHRYYEWSK
jgi:hypothetical protein